MIGYTGEKQQIDNLLRQIKEDERECLALEMRLRRSRAHIRSLWKRAVAEWLAETEETMEEHNGGNMAWYTEEELQEEIESLLLQLEENEDERHVLEREIRYARARLAKLRADAIGAAAEAE